MFLLNFKFSHWIGVFLFWFLHVQVWCQVTIDSPFVEKQIDLYTNEFRQNYNTAAYDDAFKTTDKALDYISKHFGKAHLQYANFLGYLAGLHRETGNLELSDSLFRYSKELFENAEMKDTFLFAAFLNEFGQLHTITGNYNSADTLFSKSYALLESLKNIDKTHLAAVLINWSGNSFSRGDFESFEKQLLPAKNIYEELGQQMSPGYAVILMNLGALYFEIGRFDLAEPYFLNAKNTFEKRLGKEHPYFAQCILNLANIYSELANHEESLKLSLEAEAILKDMGGTENPLYADCLVNIGSTYLNMDRFNESKIYYKAALEIWERTLGKEHFNYAFGAMSLGSVELKLSRPDEAKVLLDEAIHVMEKAIGDEKVIYFKCLAYMADYYDQKGKLNLADSMYRYVIGELESILGSENAYYLKTLSAYGYFCIKTENHARADSLFSFITQKSGDELIKATKHSTERQLSQLTVYFEQNLQSMLKYAQSRGNKLNPFTEFCYDHILLLRGFLLNSVQQIRNRSTVDSGVAKLSVELGAISYRLGKEYSKPVSQRMDVSALESQAADIEKQLVIRISGYENIHKKTNWKDTKRILKSDEVAIEFVEYNPSKTNDSDSLHYAALLIFSDSERPLMLDLFPERLLKNILLPGRADKPEESLAQVYSRGVKPFLAQSLDKIYDVIWKPMEHYLTSVKTIYFSPSGLLHRINFDAIMRKDGTNLSDHYKLVRLGSTRSIVLSDVFIPDAGNTVYLFGGIKYDVDTSVQMNEIAMGESLSLNKKDLTMDLTQGGKKFMKMHWTYLPGTAQEIQNISSLCLKNKMHSKMYSDTRATEEEFKNIGKYKNSPRIIHVATHGYFFPDRTPSAKKQMLYDSTASAVSLSGGLRQAEAKTTALHSNLSFESIESVFELADQPMFRSGLIMAGGNVAWQGKCGTEDQEDGILTAYEISQMNLSNTELVVLSACETGLGDIQGNEGVYGLQRAFKIAGAKYIIMSLWQVPDKQTSMLMIAFYKKWLEEKLNIPDAFRAAQKELRDLGLDPYQWAGFILVE